MRWQVEMTPIGKADVQSVVIEAESWQKALQGARQLRGENGPMSGFSIELLEHGYRAVDPMARLIYVVKRADDDAAVTTTPAKAEAPKVEPPPAAKVAEAEAAPAPPAPTSQRPAAPRPGGAPAPQITKVNAKQTLAFGSAGAMFEALAPKPVPLAPNTDPHFIPPPTSSTDATLATLAITDDAATSIDKGGHPELGPTAPSPSEVSATQVIFKREQDPVPQAPLTYREYVYAVANGTKEEEAERVLLAQFELVKKALENAKNGRLVNLAVFDMVFQGKPPFPPLATLSWKDWKGAPIVEFPRRKPAKAAPPPGAPPPPSKAVPAPTSAAGANEPSFSTAAAVFPPASSPLAPDPTPGPGPTERPSHASRSSRPPPMRGRAKGDELITLLFEAMHDLHFLRDAIEGADFCLSLALETLPSHAGIVHLYDIDKREFVIACANGKGTEKLLLRRHPEGDALLSKAMRKRRAVVIADASIEAGANDERYAALGSAKSFIIAPVMHGGRFIGAIEIINPSDGAPFTEDEGNALNYIAEQYAEFVAQRGIVVDAERIAMRPSPLRAR